MRKSFFTIGKNEHRGQLNFTREGEFHMWDNSQPMPEEDQVYALFPWRTHILYGDVRHIYENSYGVAIGTDEWEHITQMELKEVPMFNIRYIYVPGQGNYLIAIDLQDTMIAILDPKTRHIFFEDDVQSF